ncbi:Uncharacterised protein [Mycobacterium tuberculosis]|nr:Uncharacterised protein [Mycobacterium tuberculosis]CNV95706.1 Uncharacterised protein [Mycobacterium tuberculosis]
MVELRQGRGGGQAGGDSDGGIERAGDHHRNGDPRRDIKQRRNTAQRGDLQHRDIGGLSADNGQRILGLADAFVGGDRHIHPPAQLGEFGDGGTGLFKVFQRAVGGQGGRRGHRLGDTPATVGVHPHHGNQLPNRVDTLDVVGQALPRLGDLHLGRPGPRKPGQHLAHLGGGNGRHSGVNRNAVTSHRRRRTVGGLDRRRQPRARLRGLVLHERTEFAPTGRTLDQGHFTGGDAAETHSHRQGHHIQAVQQGF